MKLKYNLKWPNYTQHLQGVLHEMLKKEDFTDVTLVCDDMKQMKAHKTILSASSPIFKNLLNDAIPHGNPVIYLRGIPYEDMKTILQFIYVGEAQHPVDKMDEFLASAKSLKIKELCSFENSELSEKMQVGRNNFNEMRYESSEYQNNILDIVESKDEEQKKSHKDSNKSHQCPNCVIKFIDISKLEKHVSENHKHSLSKYVCEICSKNFKNSSVLKLHQMSIHEGIRHPCPHCSKKFNQAGTLGAHIKVAHEGLKYPCDQCGVKVTEKKSLRQHIESVHNGVKYDCSQCDQKFSNRGAIEPHRLAVHEGMRFLCDQCDFQASQKSALNAHIRNQKCSTWRRRGSKKIIKNQVDVSGSI